MMQHHVKNDQVTANILLLRYSGVTEDEFDVCVRGGSDSLPRSFQHVPGIVQGG